jgi:hypothetical protein
VIAFACRETRGGSRSNVEARKPDRCIEPSQAFWPGDDRPCPVIAAECCANARCSADTAFGRHTRLRHRNYEPFQVPNSAIGANGRCLTMRCRRFLTRRRAPQPGGE